MHDGGWEGFISGLILAQACDFGLFISANATGGAVTGGELIEAFFDRFTTPVAQPSISDTAVEAAEPKAGFYSPTRRNETSVERILTLLGPLRLTVDSDGTVHFKGGQWKRQPNGVYQQVDGTDRLTFKSGSAGHGYVITDGSAYQFVEHRREPALQSRRPARVHPGRAQRLGVADRRCLATPPPPVTPHLGHLAVGAGTDRGGGIAGTRFPGSATGHRDRRHQ